MAIFFLTLNGTPGVNSDTRSILFSLTWLSHLGWDNCFSLSSTTTNIICHRKNISNWGHCCGSAREHLSGVKFDPKYCYFCLWLEQCFYIHMLKTWNTPGIKYSFFVNVIIQHISNGFSCYFWEKCLLHVL